MKDWCLFSLLNKQHSLSTLKSELSFVHFHNSFAMCASVRVDGSWTSSPQLLDCSTFKFSFLWHSLCTTYQRREQTVTVDCSMRRRSQLLCTFNFSFTSFNCLVILFSSTSADLDCPHCAHSKLPFYKFSIWAFISLNLWSCLRLLLIVFAVFFKMMW